jgi:MFS family permease
MMKKSPHKIPRTVWALGFVSLFMDISSETIHALLPLYMTTTLGMSVAIVGLIDGIAEATANIVKVFSGYISDRIGKRKPLILLGYGIGALSKPLFPLATGVLPILTARFADRIGKGIRGAPRDALIADVTPPEIRGRAFGLRQSMDTIGAFVGPLLAIGLMIVFANDMRAVFWVAVIPAVIAVLCVLFGVEERAPSNQKSDIPIKLTELRQLSRRYWIVVAIGGMFSLARFSEAILILKASEEGLALWLAPTVLIVMNVVYAIGAYPAGILSDRASAKTLLIWGIGFLIAADLIFASTTGLLSAFIGICLWGIHMAMTQGLLAKLVADNSPVRLRGSAFGLFYLVTGLSLLAASVAAGLIWDRFGSDTSFLTGAFFAVVSALMLAVLYPDERTPSR